MLVSVRYVSIKVFSNCGKVGIKNVSYIMRLINNLIFKSYFIDI